MTTNIEEYRKRAIEDLRDKVWNMQLTQSWERAELDQLESSSAITDLTKLEKNLTDEILVLQKTIEALKSSKKKADRLEAKKLDLDMRAKQFDQIKVGSSRQALNDEKEKLHNDQVKRAYRIEQAKAQIEFTLTFDNTKQIPQTPNYILSQGTYLAHEKGKIKKDEKGNNVLYVSKSA